MKTEEQAFYSPGVRIAPFSFSLSWFKYKNRENCIGIVLDISKIPTLDFTWVANGFEVWDDVIKQER